MATWIWILIAVIVIAVLAAAGMAAARQRRTAALRARFGPEYDRALRDRGDKRAAEAELLDRQHEREQLDIRPLPEPDRVVFAAEWSDVQESFVDRPSDAVIAADMLVTRVMEARGYPMGDFEAQASLVSVDHPGVVASYRSAHDLCERARGGEAGTEDLREALLRYRSLFSELLEPAGDTAAGSRDTAAGSQAAQVTGEERGSALAAADDSRDAPDGNQTIAAGSRATPAGSQAAADEQATADEAAADEAAAPRAASPGRASTANGNAGRAAPEAGPREPADPDYQDAPVNRRGR